MRDNDESNVVASGDLQAAALAGKGKKEPKIKKIPDNERKTTPYMTKYEKARILGTRALQIRCVHFGERDTSSKLIIYAV